MADSLLFDLLAKAARRWPQRPALRFREHRLSYAELARRCNRFAQGLAATGMPAGERLAVYLPKRLETVIALFGASLAGAVIVPINPQLKAAQVGHILRDSGAHALVTGHDRLPGLGRELAACPALRRIIEVDGPDPDGPVLDGRANDAPLAWHDLAEHDDASPLPERQASDLAALLYTSGSTGQPKGVMLSHRNMLVGAHSVAEYLENTASDRLLALLPLSFDYGFSQLTTAFSVGAEVVLFNYLLPRQVLNAVAEHDITGLAAVPPLWNQLAGMDWPDTRLRYITSSGGVMPAPTIDGLRQRLPNTRVFVMYGLTEAFRSTYLPPEELDRRTGSMGRAIPNADIRVLHSDGSPCAAGEPGELVHLGPLVGQGYWRRPEQTAARFRPVPGVFAPDGSAAVGVWSGDTVRADQDGYLYFVARRDEMIKSSGYRISPGELEAPLMESGLVTEIAAFGVPHPQLGQAVVVVAKPANAEVNEQALQLYCRQYLPGYMLPAHISLSDDLPRSANGKIDRNLLKGALLGLFDTSD